jgi:hypothetical protein
VVTVEAVLGVCVLLIVPFLTGSARAQAGDGAAPTVDGAIVALGLVLLASLAASFYAANRVALLRTSHAEVSGRAAGPGRNASKQPAAVVSAMTDTGQPTPELKES